MATIPPAILDQSKAASALSAAPILIRVSTKVEAQAIIKVFSADPQQARFAIQDKAYYALGIHGGATIFMVQSSMDTIQTTLTVHQAIQDLHPQAVILCGVAYGLHPKKQRLGDILVASQLCYYEPQKVDIQHGTMPRGNRMATPGRLLDRFRNADLEWAGAPTHFGLVLSGEKLVNDPAFRDHLLAIETEAIGGDIGGFGLYAAASDAKVDHILVEAICDWADGSKNNDAQALAAINAAQFVLHAIQLGKWDRSDDREVFVSHSIFGTPNKHHARDLFMLMPFRPKLKPIYENHIVKVAKELNLSIARGDEFFSQNAIMQEIWSAITQASILIADCTEKNPNVFYEIGIAHTLEKPVILIAQKPDEIPFDLQHRRYIQYDPTSDMEEFERVLSLTILETIKEVKVTKYYQ